MAVVTDKNKLQVVENPSFPEVPSIPMKKKYRENKTFNFGTYRSRTGNSHGPTPKRRGVFTSRKRAAGPWL